MTKAEKEEMEIQKLTGEIVCRKKGEHLARNICEVTRLTGISGTQAKRLIETGNASIRGWVLDELGRSE